MVRSDKSLALPALLRSGRASALIVFVVAFGVYGNSLSNGFVFDDEHLIVQNPWIKDVRHLPEILFSDIFSYREEGAANYYRPLMSFYYMADYYIFGLKPWGFHLSYVLSHGAVSVMLFFVVCALLGRSGGVGGREEGYGFVPIAAALLFAAHPIHTQVVAWNAIHEISLAFFFLLSMLLHIKGRRGVVPLCFFLAAMSKETAAALPLVLFAYDVAFRRDSVWPLGRSVAPYYLKVYLPLIVVGLAYTALRTYALGAVVPVKRHTELGAVEYLFNALPLFVDYFGKLVLPVNLNAAYVFEPVTSVFALRGAIAIIFAVAFIAALWLSRRRSPAVFVCLVVIGAPLLPVLYIPAMGFHVFAENYLYLPSAGFVVLLAMGVSALGGFVGGVRAKAATVVVIVVIVTIYGAATIQRNRVWHDEYALWTDTVKKSPTSYLVRNNTGRALAMRGDFSGALEHFRISVELEPRFRESHINLANTYDMLGMSGEARSVYKDIIRSFPGTYGARYNLGVSYERAGRFKEALREYELALEEKPGFVPARRGVERVRAAMAALPG